MPKGIVKTPADEKRWKAAKKAAHKQYPDIKESDTKFWKIVTSIYRSMKGKK